MGDLPLSAVEVALVIANAVICLGILIYCIRAKDRSEFWCPLLFIAAIYGYYVILGPLIALKFGPDLDRGVAMRPYYEPAWIGALVGLISLMLGYCGDAVCGSNKRTPHHERPIDAFGLWRLGIALNIIGFISFAITMGTNVFSKINPLAGIDEPTSGAYTGAFINYFALAVNFLIPGCSLLLVVFLRGYRCLFSFSIWTLITLGIYLTLGFRYRLVLLAAAMSFIFYMTRRRRPNIILMAIVATLFVVIMGQIGSVRRYGEGLDLSQRTNWSESIVDGFGEAGIFSTSGAVLAIVPSQRAFVGFEPIKQTLVMPVPAKIYKRKATDAYMLKTLIAIYGPDYYLGAAYMFFAEWYQAFWWPGVIIANLLLGWGCHRLWRWYRIREDDPLALAVYSSAVPFLYVIESRGYTPQVVMLFVYSVVPTIVLYRWPRRISRFAPSFGAKLNRNDKSARTRRIHLS